MNEEYHKFYLKSGMRLPLPIHDFLKTERLDAVVEI